jgi:threonine/homoserine/homoserine lactone efflux protein
VICCADSSSNSNSKSNSSSGSNRNSYKWMGVLTNLINNQPIISWSNILSSPSHVRYSTVQYNTVQ